MLEQLQHYVKFVGGTEQEAAARAAAHLESVGLKTRILSSCEATELAKLTETTYFGVLIAWAQEVERYCDSSGVAYDEVISFFREIGYLPRVDYFPGVIGGHCVMPNIEILSDLYDSDILEAIKASNARKIARDSCARAESPETARPRAATVLSVASR
jgi:hypothetical protein